VDLCAIECVDMVLCVSNMFAIYDFVDIGLGANRRRTFSKEPLCPPHRISFGKVPLPQLSQKSQAAMQPQLEIHIVHTLAHTAQMPLWPRTWATNCSVAHKFVYGRGASLDQWGGGTGKDTRGRCTLHLPARTYARTKNNELPIHRISCLIYRFATRPDDCSLQGSYKTRKKNLVKPIC